MDPTERARAILRGAKLRVTITRATLVAAMLKRHEPVSLEDAVKLCGENGGDQATVYRNLQALHEAGVLRPVRGVGRREMFELCEACMHDASHHHHHAHVSCTKCGKVECIELGAEPQRPAGPKGWAIADVTLTAWGLCPECR
jgi:Fur family zinc uptake transcriptional regulator/Fur family ferric uptake transcriptional regulator